MTHYRERFMNPSTELISFPSIQEPQQVKVLEDYVGLCAHRWRLITLCAVGAAVGAAVWSLTLKPIYQAKATVVIQQEGPDALDRERGHARDTSPEYFQTHFELLRSHQVLKETAVRVKLAEQPEYRSNATGAMDVLANAIRKSIQDLFGSAAPKGSDVQAIQDDVLLRRFSDHIQVLPVRGARLAHVTVMSEDPNLAALAANTLVSVYIDRSQELSLKSKEAATQWYTGHLTELRGKVEASEQALYMFRLKHGLLPAKERQTVAAGKLADLNSELVKAEMRKAEAHTRLQQLQMVLVNHKENGALDWSKLDASTEALNSPLIQTLRAQEIKASGTVAELSDKYGSLHPKMARSEAELRDLRARIQEEFRKIYDSVKQEYNTAIAREQKIRETVARYSTDKIDVEKYDIEHGMLEREAQSNQHLYDVFLKVMKEADLSMGIRANNVYLADPAVASMIPVRPQKTLNTLLGFLVGLMTGAGVAFVLEARDRSLRGPNDIERYLPRLSLLGVVPRLSVEDTMKGSLLLAPQSTGPAAESFRTIRTSLLLSNPRQLPSCVLITSPGANEGKTTLAVNLALAISQLDGKRVVLIDADLRHLSPHKIFTTGEDTESPKGLKQFLVGQAEPWEIVYSTDTPNLFVVPRGDRSANASELLSAARMSKLLTWCRAEGFHILIDAPPVLPVTDAVVLGMQVDGVLMVVSAGKTTLQDSRWALRRLTTSGSKVLGIVMQKARLIDTPYYSS